MKLEEFYDDHDDSKKLRGKSWIVLFVLSFIVVAVTMFGMIKDMLLKNNGNYVTADYDGNGGRYVAYNEGETSYSIYVDYFVVHDDDTINLYYFGDDIAGAKALTAAGWYIFIYTSVGGFMLAGLIMTIRRNRKSHHSEGVEPLKEKY